ncbi:MAG TPA: hypothetical protein ENI33_08220 [Thermoplasmatales archaeon]|nr:hypothetical protein [Thermoplasmatales archaeon]
MKKIILVVVALLIAGCIGGEEKLEEEKKVLIIVPPYDFNYDEFIGVKDSLEKDVKIVTMSSVEEPISEDGKKIVVDVDSSKFGTAMARINISEYSAFVFIGGRGVKAYFEDRVIASIIKYGFEMGILGAIGTAPVILATAHTETVFEGRNMTCDPSQIQNLTKMGVNYVEENVVVDGNIITASGADYAQEFAEAIKSKLS